MALAEDPTTATIEESAHLALLRQFILDGYRVSDSPTARLDGATLVRRFAVFAHQHDVDPPPAHLVYSAMRAMGLIVRRHSQNRMTVFGIEEQPLAATHLHELDAGWPDLADHVAAQQSDHAVQRALQAVQQTLVLAPAVIEESADLLLEIMRTTLDEDRKVRIATAFLDRGIAKVRPREVEDPAIEAKAIEQRPGLAEIEAVLARNRIIDTSATGAVVPDGSGAKMPEGESASGSTQSANSSKHPEGEALPTPPVKGNEPSVSPKKGKNQI